MMTADRRGSRSGACGAEQRSALWPSFAAPLLSGRRTFLMVVVTFPAGNGVGPTGDALRLARRRMGHGNPKMHLDPYRLPAGSLTETRC